MIAVLIELCQMGVNLSLRVTANTNHAADLRRKEPLVSNGASAENDEDRIHDIAPSLHCCHNTYYIYNYKSSDINILEVRRFYSFYL